MFFLLFPCTSNTPCFQGADILEEKRGIYVRNNTQRFQSDERTNEGSESQGGGGKKTPKRVILELKWRDERLFH